MLGDLDQMSPPSSSSSSALVGRRTVRVLAAVARGAWVLQPSWLYECLDKQEWVDEAAHAISGYGAAATAEEARRQLLEQSCEHLALAGREVTIIVP